MRRNASRRTVAALAVTLSLLAPAAQLGAREITAQERARLVELLTTTRDDVLKEAAKLSDAQWNFKQGPERWSVGEVVEHLALAENLLFDLQQKAIASPAATPAQSADAKGMDDKILTMIADRTQKATAPEPLKPGTLGTRDKVLAAFRERRGNTLKYAKTTKDDLRAHVAASPVGTNLDAYQWLLFLSAHTTRHLAQIREVKADPKFPSL
jgi:hypothetical protein